LCNCATDGISDEDFNQFHNIDPIEISAAKLRSLEEVMMEHIREKY